MATTIRRNPTHLTNLLRPDGTVEVEPVLSANAFRVRLTFTVPDTLYVDEMAVYAQALHILTMFENKEPNEDNS